MLEDAKVHLHQKLRAVREALVWKLDGLSEYAGEMRPGSFAGGAEVAAA